jgi:PTH2 family peptidyl-tRNA hydrolase
MADEKRLVIRYNTNANMSRGKMAAHAVHAALKLYGIEYDHPVIVLGGKPREIVADHDVHVRDQGRTELEPGTLTAGARWETADGARCTQEEAPRMGAGNVRRWRRGVLHGLRWHIDI